MLVLKKRRYGRKISSFSVTRVIIYENIVTSRLQHAVEVWRFVATFLVNVWRVLTAHVVEAPTVKARTVMTR